MLEAGLETGTGIGLVSTFPVTIAAMSEELRQMAASRGY